MYFLPVNKLMEDSNNVRSGIFGIYALRDNRSINDHKNHTYSTRNLSQP